MFSCPQTFNAGLLSALKIINKSANGIFNVCSVLKNVHSIKLSTNSQNIYNMQFLSSIIIIVDKKDVWP